LPELSIVVISWNARDVLKGCLESLKPVVADGSCRVLVVDNASEDGSAEMVSSDYPDVTLIKAESNLGFARANNLALASTTTDYVLLLNSDTVVTRDAILRMLTALKTNPEYAIVGCRQVDGDGNEHNAFGRFPSLRRELSTLTGAFQWPVVRWLIARRRTLAAVRAKSRNHDCEDPGASGIAIAPVEWINGACMMMRRDIGGLDERFFFYGEDIDICMRAWKSRRGVGFLPDVSIVHYGGVSSKSNYLVLLRQFMIAQLQLFDKHHSRGAVIGLKCVYLAAGCTALVKWWFIRMFMPGRRHSAMEWIKFWTGSLPAILGGVRRSR